MWRAVWSPGHRLLQERHVLGAAFDARDDQYGHLVEVFGQVGGPSSSQRQFPAQRGQGTAAFPGTIWLRSRPAVPPTSSYAQNFTDLRAPCLDQHRADVRADRRISHVGTIPSVTTRNRDSRHRAVREARLAQVAVTAEGLSQGGESNSSAHQALPKPCSRSVAATSSNNEVAKSSTRPGSGWMAAWPGCTGPAPANTPCSWCISSAAGRRSRRWAYSRIRRGSPSMTPGLRTMATPALSISFCCAHSLRELQAVTERQELAETRAQLERARSGSLTLRRGSSSRRGPADRAGVCLRAPHQGCGACRAARQPLLSAIAAG
jgi:hypothetical protein